MRQYGIHRIVSEMDGLLSVLLSVALWPCLSLLWSYNSRKGPCVAQLSANAFVAVRRWWWKRRPLVFLSAAPLASDAPPWLAYSAVRNCVCRLQGTTWLRGLTRGPRWFNEVCQWSSFGFGPFRLWVTIAPPRVNHLAEWWWIPVAASRLVGRAPRVWMIVSAEGCPCWCHVAGVHVRPAVGRVGIRIEENTAVDHSSRWLWWQRWWRTINRGSDACRRPVIAPWFFSL